MLLLLWLQPLSITLRGITNAAADPSVDVWRTVTLPLLRQATGLSEGFELKIIKRGAEPLVRTAISEGYCLLHCISGHRVTPESAALHNVCTVPLLIGVWACLQCISQLIVCGSC